MSIPDRVLQFCLPTQNISRNPVTYPDGYFLYSVSRVYFQFQKNSRNPVTYPDGYFPYFVSRVYFQFQKNISIP